jgi:predicted ATPase/class 3 adenylate cyclase
MFVDISGFTPLTEQLMQHGNEGAEVLSIILNEIFEPMVGHVYAANGFIPHFAGDAFTGIFAEVEPLLVARCALHIQELFEEQPVRKTKFGNFPISVKLGISSGDVEWGVVGAHNKMCYFKGQAIEGSADAEHRAHPQEIIIDKQFRKVLVQSEATVEQIDSKYFRLFRPLNGLKIKMPILKSDLANIKPEVLRGEFRSVVSVFISFEDVDTNHLERFASTLIEKFENFSGYFKELDFGDKGAVAVGFFGAPVAFENNVSRALEFVLSLKEEIQSAQYPLVTNLPIGESFITKFRVGMTSGVAFTGTIGGKERSQYAIVGDKVNLAARLMLKAEWSAILVDKEVQNNRLFDFSDKGNIRYKGVAENVPTYQFLDKKLEEKPFFSGTMIGRTSELEQLYQFSKSTESGIAYIFGEPGIGKSRLSYELREKVDANSPTVWANCQADQILRKPFNPFIYFLKNYFKHLPNGQTPIGVLTPRTFEIQFEALVRQLPEVAYATGSELIRTKSVIAALVGISYPNSLWEQLDAKGRYENTLAALANLFLALSFSKKLVIEIEDAHWLDESSIAFLDFFVTKLVLFNQGKNQKNTAISIIITSRYSDEGVKIYPLSGLHDLPKLELDLNIFSQKALKEFAYAKLQKEIHPDLQELIWRTTNGNPFYAEQILAYFVENSLLEWTDSTVNIKDKNIKISNSISAILTARIDRLSTLVKETVKAAAVIGREFELPVLSEVMMNHEEFILQNGNSQLVLKEQIQSAEKGQIWRAMNELRYIFRHNLLREAVYDMQMHTQLRELHLSIAHAIEKIYIDKIEERYVDLAFHYEQAHHQSNTHKYLQLAAEHARRNFQNQQAIDFYDRLLKLAPKPETQIHTLIKKGEILQIIGKWHESEILYHEALFKSAESVNIHLKGSAHNALGNLLMLKGDYDSAANYLHKSAAFFETPESNQNKQSIVTAYGNLGNLFFRQGDYDQAKDYFTRCTLMIRENGLRSNPQIVSNLGLTYMNQGNYTEGILCQLEELEICEKLHDKQGMAILNINLGIVYFEKGDDNSALVSFDKGLVLSQELGNKQLISIVMGCIGNLYRVKGNFEKAGEYLDLDLKMTQELGDKQGIAIASELIGKLHSTKGDFETALAHLQTSLGHCRSLHYQKGIAKACHGIGEIYSFQNDFIQAIQYFDEAINISRYINNQLILGHCLVDKGNVLIKAGDFSGAMQLRLEALGVAKNIGNDKLMRQVKSFVAKFK